MKKFLICLTVTMLGWMTQSFAADIPLEPGNLGEIATSQSIGNTIQSAVGQSTPFLDRYTFTTPANANDIGISVTNVAVNGVNNIPDITATLDGKALQKSTTDNGVILLRVISGGGAINQRNHTLVVTGTVTEAAEAASYGGNIAVSLGTSPVPVPAAVWLFGSALCALFGIGRKQKALA